MHHYNCLNITAKDMTMQAFTLRHLVYACCLAAVSVSANAAAANHSQSTVDRQIAEGKQLARQYCMQCHALPSPQQHTPEQWLNVVIRMEGYMSNRGLAVPDDKTAAAILTYLDSDSD